MAERRSMNEALRLTEKERAFIHGEEPSAPTKQKAAREKDDAKQPRKPKRSSGDPQPRQHTTRSTSTGQRPKSLDNDGSFGELLVPVTTRLSLDTANALRRACLERKLKRK